MSYDGHERRKDDNQMLVIMTEIANDMKHMVKAFDSHVIDDQKTAKKVNELELNVARWGGGLAVLICIMGIAVSMFK
jgi:hypothetical protein